MQCVRFKQKLRCLCIYLYFYSWILVFFIMSCPVPSLIILRSFALIKTNQGFFSYFHLRMQSYLRVFFPLQDSVLSHLSSLSLSFLCVVGCHTVLLWAKSALSEASSGLRFILTLAAGSLVHLFLSRTDAWSSGQRWPGRLEGIP